MPIFLHKKLPPLFGHVYKEAATNPRRRFGSSFRSGPGQGPRASPAAPDSLQPAPSSGAEKAGGLALWEKDGAGRVHPRASPEKIGGMGKIRGPGVECISCCLLDLETLVECKMYPKSTPGDKGLTHSEHCKTILLFSRPLANLHFTWKMKFWINHGPLWSQKLQATVLRPSPDVALQPPKECRLKEQVRGQAETNRATQKAGARHWPGVLTSQNDSRFRHMMVVWSPVSWLLLGDFPFTSTRTRGQLAKPPIQTTYIKGYLS